MRQSRSFSWLKASSMGATNRDVHTLRGCDAQQEAICQVPQQYSPERIPSDSIVSENAMVVDCSAHIASHCLFKDTFCHNCQKGAHCQSFPRPHTTGRQVAIGNPGGGHQTTK